MSIVLPEHRLCVAPMMERTDRHCRYLLRLIAPRAWLYTEMVTARALVHGDRARLLRFDALEHPVALQIGGSEPAELAAAARWGEEAGYDEINLNVGCPSGRVQAGCFGAALMREPERVAECVAAMGASVHVPVTVKTRLGVDDHDSYEFLHTFARQVVDAGCGTLIVHARKAWLKGLSPKQNREIPPLDYARVYRLKGDFPRTEIVINGGLSDAAVTRAQWSHVDGVMLGRAAYDEPMLMAEIDALAYSETRTAAEGRSDMAERAHVLERYLRYAEREVDAGTRLNAMTRPLAGMYAREPGGRAWRRELSLLPDGSAGLRQLRRLVAEHGERACMRHREVATITHSTFHPN